MSICQVAQGICWQLRSKTTASCDQRKWPLNFATDGSSLVKLYKRSDEGLPFEHRLPSLAKTVLGEEVAFGQEDQNDCALGNVLRSAGEQSSAASCLLRDGASESQQDSQLVISCAPNIRNKRR
eukprot:6183212-Pleurochrysis_carterae.AAC.2